jgi:hypothetical protein
LILELYLTTIQLRNALKNVLPIELTRIWLASGEKNGGDEIIMGEFKLFIYFTGDNLYRIKGKLN